MRIVLSVDDLAFFDRVPETLHFTLEPAGEDAYSPSDIIAGVTSAPLRFAA